MEKLWTKKARNSSHPADSGGGLLGSGLNDALATRRSGTMATSASSQLHHKARDVHMLEEQLQSVQIQLQEKHNELNYFKAHCEELEREISRMRLQLALKDEEISDLLSRLEAAGISAITPRRMNDAPKKAGPSECTSTSSTTVVSPIPTVMKPAPTRSNKPSWVVGVGNRQSKRLSMLWKDTAMFSTQSPPSSTRESSLDLAMPQVSEPSRKNSEGGIGAVLNAQLEAVRERRNSETKPVLPSASENSETDTHRSGTERSTTASSDSACTTESDPVTDEQPASTAMETANSMSPTTSESPTSHSAPQKQVRLECTDEGELVKMASIDDNSDYRNRTQSQKQRRATRGRSQSVDWSSESQQIAALSKSAEGEECPFHSPRKDKDEKEFDVMFDGASDVSQKRRSWVKAGSPWQEDDPSVAEAKWAKRKSLSALRLLKEEGRKGFSYKSFTGLISPCQGFAIENEYDYTTKTDTNYYSFLHQTWYKDHFYKQDHACFIGVDTPLGTVVVVVKKEKDPSSIDYNHQYRIMVITQDGDQKSMVPGSAIGAAGSTPGWAFRVIESAFPLLQTTGSLKLVDHPQLPQALFTMEEKERPRKYKFGVVLVRKGQVTEEDFFCNQRGSSDWEMFLRLLGNRVNLQGWEKFAGGLDVRTGTTGTDSVYTEWRDNQIMFHVSTLLPYTQDDRQQIERKRHIGNDIVLVVFLDDKSASYCPSLIKSHFIHVVIVVRVEKRDECGAASHLRVAVSSKEGVPVFGPTLPKPALFPVANPRSFRDFFLSKLINGELAAYRTASFSRKLRVARRALLDDISLKYWS